MNFEITAQTIKDCSKERNGDAYTHAVVAGAGGEVVIAMLADGVGSRPCDWLASRTACDRLKVLATETLAVRDDLVGSLKEIMSNIDQEIWTMTGRGRGMMCAAAVVAWPVGSNTAWFANIGDTRIYTFEKDQVRQRSVDDSLAVVRRGPQGTPLLSGGAVVVQRGITNALGSGYARIEFDSIPLLAGGSLVLASDGFYECSSGFEKDVALVLVQEDLSAALENLAYQYDGRNKDDATALLLRRA